MLTVKADSDESAFFVALPVEKGPQRLCLVASVGTIYKSLIKI